MEDAVGAPARLDDARSPGRRRRSAARPATRPSRDRRDPQPRRVPGHVRVVPLDPGERRPPSGEGRGAATKSGPVTRTRPSPSEPSSAIATSSLRDEVESCRASAVVGLADGVQARPDAGRSAGRRSATGPRGSAATGLAAPSGSRRHSRPSRDRRGDDPPARHRVRAAAVLVDAVADVERRRRQLDASRRRARAGAASAGRPRPGRPSSQYDVVAVHPRLAEADARRRRRARRRSATRQAAVRRDVGRGASAARPASASASRSGPVLPGR